MKYFKLFQNIRDEDADISENLNLGEGYGLWIGGKRFKVPVHEPIESIIDEDDEGIMLPTMYRAVYFMRQDFLAALQEAGVDNLDIYDAVITETRTGKVHRNYKAVNIIGVVRAANLNVSGATDFGIVHDQTSMIFDDLKMDYKKIIDLRLFRLGESCGTVIINETVKNHLASKNFKQIEFIEV